MERIVITEKDNTSNVETLSSYDVVYVPGFSNNRNSALFRVPTLVTTKYEFFKLFGDGSENRCPTFPKDQPYPIASADTYGFPPYAIPNYVPVSAEPEKLSGISTVENVTSSTDLVNKVTENGYYEHVSFELGEEPGSGNWFVAKLEDTTAKIKGLDKEYTYKVKDASTLPSVDGLYVISQVQSPSGNPSAQGWLKETGSSTGVYTFTSDTSVSGTYYEASNASGSYVSGTIYAQKDYSNLNIFRCIISPVSRGWAEKIEGQYVGTTDEVISFLPDTTTIKDYYKAIKRPSLMFNGPSDTRNGDGDPGYRYALYLLSLGIPVYYEQMNSPFEDNEINLNDGTYSVGEDNKYYKNGKIVNPKDNRWFIYSGGSYVRTTDEYISGDSEQTYYMGADISIESMYDGLTLRFSQSGVDEEGKPIYDALAFDNIGDYSIKYFSTGGYPVFEYGLNGDSGIAIDMIKVASTRGDAVALIDHTNNPDRSIYETDEYSVISRVRNGDIGNLDEVTGSYGTMFTPWYECTNTFVSGTASMGGPFNNQMPGSLAFLSALSRQLNNYNPWLAVAGCTRGLVPYFGKLHTNYVLTNNVADSYQMLPDDASRASSGTSVSINAITSIRDAGYCIWGNRTLRNNSNGTQSTSFLNIRDVLSDIKKTLYEASQKLMFEQNNDILWINFKALVAPLLEKMKSNMILSDYALRKYNVDPETGYDVPAYKLLAVVEVRPINSIEVFNLEIRIENNDFEVREVEE